MNSVGIDVSKGKSMVAVMQPMGVVAVKPFEVVLTAEALEKLAYFLKDLPGETRVILEWVDFAHDFWHADCVSSLSEKAFTEKYRKWCKRRGYDFSASKAADVYLESLGHVIMLPKNASTKLLIQQAIASLNAVSQTAEGFRIQRLAQLLPEYSVVMAMYGVGDSVGPKLMAEIGDVRRFANKRALVAYAGIGPQPSQSGKLNTKINKISRKGAPGIRKAVYQSMTTLLRKSPADEPVYQFLDKKRAEGKPYFVYMTAAANKFLRIYYARVKEHLDALDIVDSE